MIRILPSCVGTTLADLLVGQVLIVVPANDPFIRQLDAIAIGIGENAFPTEDTPAP